MMQLLTFALVVFAVIDTGCILSQVSAVPVKSGKLDDKNCTTADLNGYVEIGCWGYKKCVDGNFYLFLCPEGQVLERDTMTCVYHGTGHTDCAERFTCVGKDDQFYADLGDHCQTYIRCVNQVVHGPLYCPGDLVFHEKLQTCDYKSNVESPCGSKVVTESVVAYLEAGDEVENDKKNCTTADLNGYVEIGCWGYKKCVDGNTYMHLCPDGQVLERDTMTCVDIGTGHTDCDEKLSCIGKGDQFYPDLGDHCQTYVRCLNEVVLGPLYCPAGLVFNEKDQTCDYKTNVLPPCGSKAVVG